MGNSQRSRANTHRSLAAVLDRTGGVVPVAEAPSEEDGLVLPPQEGPAPIDSPGPSDPPETDPAPDSPPDSESKTAVESLVERGRRLLRRAKPSPEERQRAELEDAMVRFRSEWFRYAARQVGEDAAEDALQEVWVRLWSKRAEVNQPSEWMYGCLRTVLRELQDPAHRMALRESHLSAEQVESLAEGAQEEPEDAYVGALRNITECAALTDQEREAVLLRTQGVAVRVIAQRFGLKLRGMESLLQGARDKMRAQVVAGNAILNLREGE